MNQELDNAKTELLDQLIEGDEGLDPINILAKVIHQRNIEAGWWEDAVLGDLKDPQLIKFVVPTKLCLAHSEISEGLEGFRKGLQDDHLPHRPMIEVEIADALIRLLDVAGALNLDVGGAVLEKMAYNSIRADHKKEAREAGGGKSI